MVEENKRSKEAVEEDVQRLKEWLSKQPHLPQDVEPNLLTAFVCGTKTLERAKQKLDAYYSNRNKAVKLYDEIGRDFNAKFREKSKAVNQFFLTNPSPEGYQVYFLSMTESFSKAFDHAHEATRLLMMLELLMLKKPESTSGYIVFDCALMPSTALTMFSPTVITAYLSSFQEGYPIKNKGIFVINAPPFVEFIVNNMVKPVVKAKLFNRIHIVNEGISFFKDKIPLELLPSNYGGKDKSCEELNDYWLNQLEENRGWFQESAKTSSDEKKRPPDSKNTYGIDGTFRKLAVD